MYDLAAALLTVDDLDRAVGFYTDTLGFMPGRSRDGRWSEVISTRFSLVLVERRDGQAFARHGASGITLVVHDLERKKKILEARGAVIAEAGAEA